MTVQDATDLLTWIIEQSEGDKGQLAYEAELATEDATDDLAKALTA